jgi:hypothetical protein
MAERWVHWTNTRRAWVSVAAALWLLSTFSSTIFNFYIDVEMWHEWNCIKALLYHHLIAVHFFGQMKWTWPSRAMCCLGDTRWRMVSQEGWQHWTYSRRKQSISTGTGQVHSCIPPSLTCFLGPVLSYYIAVTSKPWLSTLLSPKHCVWMS